MSISSKSQKYKTAENALRKSISIKPDFALAYNDLGAILIDQGNTNEASAAFKKALSIDPYNFYALSNMGAALIKLGELDEALKVYKKAMDINPNSPHALHNVGNILHAQGKPEKAIKTLKKALGIDVDLTDAWRSIAFPLTIVKQKTGSIRKLRSEYEKIGGVKDAQVEKAILTYRLSIGDTGVEKKLDEAIKFLARDQNKNIENSNHLSSSTDLKIGLSTKIINLTHFGRSGTGLLHSLIDGHSEVSTLPSFYLSEYFDYRNWNNLISGGWDNIIDNFIATYEVLFDASSRNPIKNKKVIYDMGIKEGLANVGDKGNETLQLNKKIFKSELNHLMSCHSKLDAYKFFMLIHKAYDKTIDDTNNKNLIFYHIHNPDLHAQLNFVRLVPHAKWIMMVREPIQSCDSWLHNSSDENSHIEYISKIMEMLLEIDNVVYQKQESVGVRLEDLKQNPNKTIKAICAWMGIEETKSLYEMTAQGKWWETLLAQTIQKMV